MPWKLMENYRVKADYCLAFTVHGNVLVNNIFSLAACIILVATVVFLVIRSMIWRKWWKNPAFFVIMILLGISMPLLTNVILLISPNLTYHLLMRYQWVLYLILMTAFADRYTAEESRTDVVLQWAALCAAVVLVFDYGISDNIGYSNLEKIPCLRQFLLQRCGIRLLLLQLYLQRRHIVRHAGPGSIADGCRIGSTDLLGIIIRLGFQQGQFISTLCLRVVGLCLHYRILQQCPNRLHAVFRKFQKFLAFHDTLPAGGVDLLYLQIFLYGIIVIITVILVIITDVQSQIVIYGFCVVFQRAALSNTYL